MRAEHARGGEDGFTDRSDFGVVGSAVHEVMQGVPGKGPAHLADHTADDQCGDRVEDGVTSEVADDPDGDDQRRGGVRTGVPGVGDEHAGLDPLGHGKHVAEQKLFGD